MSRDSDLSDSFRKRLDQEYEWPAKYLFKFIVPSGQEYEILKIFEGLPVSTKYSKNKNYVSITSEITMGSSDEIIDIYRQANLIEGIIAL